MTLPLCRRQKQVSTWHSPSLSSADAVDVIHFWIFFPFFYETGGEGGRKRGRLRKKEGGRENVDVGEREKNVVPLNKKSIHLFQHLAYPSLFFFPLSPSHIPYPPQRKSKKEKNQIEEKQTSWRNRRRISMLM